MGSKIMKFISLIYRKNVVCLYNYLSTYIKLLKFYSKEKLILEIHAADHCNLNCKGCCHYSPIAEQHFCDLDILEKNMTRLSRYSKCFHPVHILGGEPLLFPGLNDMIRIVRKHLPDKTIKVVTNGILLSEPDKISENFWKTCRENNIIIKITPYPINIDYESMRQLCISKGVTCQLALKEGKTEISWTKRLFNETGSDCMEFKFRLLKILKCKKRCFQVVDDKLYGCNAPAYIHHVNKKFHTHFKTGPKDYIKISKLRNNFQIRKLQLFGSPFCRYCYPPVKSQWEISRKVKEEWIESKQ